MESWPSSRSSVQHCLTYNWTIVKSYISFKDWSSNKFKSSRITCWSNFSSALFNHDDVLFGWQRLSLIDWLIEVSIVRNFGRVVFSNDWCNTSIYMYIYVYIECCNWVLFVIVWSNCEWHVKRQSTCIPVTGLIYHWNIQWYYILVGHSCEIFVCKTILVI